MYSRAQNRPVKVPEHYSGWAFRGDGSPAPAETPAKPEPAPPLRFAEAARPTPLPEARKRPVREDTAPSAPPQTPGIEPPVLLLPPGGQTPPLSEGVRHLFGSLGTAFPFSHGIGSDEWLLIGMILLLAQSGGDADLLRMLTLLLFCG